MVTDDKQIIEALLAVTGRLARDAPFDAGAGELCGKLAFLGGARGLALYAVHRDATAELLGAYGLPADYLRRFPVRAARPLAHLTGDLRDAARREEPVSVLGLGEDPRTVSLGSVALEGRFASTLSIPLIYEGALVGLVHAFHTPHLRPDRQQLLVRAAPLLAATLARERLRAGAAVGTALAGEGAALYPRAQLERQLRHLHAAAERYQRTYSVAVYAVDRPDILARRYGVQLVRQAVDELLRCVAGECRDADQAGRYGDASCVVLMPDTEQHGAFTQCQRVLARFGRHPFRCGDARLQLSTSAGISCYPENGALGPEGSVAAAEQALVEALGETGQRIIAIAARGSAAPMN